jgi:hypothetical protein
MDTPPPQAGSLPSRRIDLTHETDVAYWCRIFNVTIEELREAVQHAGPQVDEVRRYLSSHPPASP